MSSAGIGRGRAYAYNPACGCDWCRNGGKPTGGYWSHHILTGERVWQPNDCYGNEHMPPSGWHYKQ